MKNAYEIRGDVTAIFINYKDSVMETLIDTVDLPIAQSVNVTWRAVKAYVKHEKYYIYGSFYVKREGKKLGHMKNIALARLLMGFPEGLVVDHINDDSLNNCRSTNLQSITNIENVQKQVKRLGPRKKSNAKRGLCNYET